MESFTLNNQSEGFDFPLVLVNFNNNLEQNDTDKFASGFHPWGDYVFGSILIISGKRYPIYKI